MSNLELELLKVEHRLSQIFEYILKLQCEGVKADDPIFKVLSQKSWELVYRWEVLTHKLNKIKTTREITSDASPGEWFEKN